MGVRMTVTEVDRRKAMMQAGRKLDARGMSSLTKSGERKMTEGRPREAATLFRNALQFADILFGQEHVWTTSIAGQLANALERDLADRKCRASGGENATARVELAMLRKDAEQAWARARGFFSRGTKRHKRAKLRRTSQKRRVTQIEQNRECSRESKPLVDLNQLEAGQYKRLGSQARPLILKENNMTPRSRQACVNAGVAPSRLQKCDRHSFYEPGMTNTAQRQRCEAYEQARQRLLAQLIDDRWVIKQEDESGARTKALQLRLEQEAEVQLRKKFINKNDKNMHRAAKEPRPILLRSNLKHGSKKGSAIPETQYKGAYEAATQLAIEMEMSCPACGTLFDFRNERCRTCTKRVDWNKVVKQSENRLGQSMKNRIVVAPAYAVSVFPSVQARLAQDPAAKPVYRTDSIGGLFRASKKIDQRIRKNTISLPAQDAKRNDLQACTRTGKQLASSSSSSSSATATSPGWAIQLHTARMSKLSQTQRMLDKIGVQQQKEMRRLAFLSSNQVQKASVVEQRQQDVAKLYRAVSRDDLHAMFDGLGLESISARIQEVDHLLHQFS